MSEFEGRFPSFSSSYCHANVISYTQWVEMEQERKEGAVGIDNRSIISGISLGWGVRELFLFLETRPDITALHNSGNVINLLSLHVLQTYHPPYLNILKHFGTYTCFYLHAKLCVLSTESVFICFILCPQ